MHIHSEARTGDVRALATSIALGAVLGLGVGGAYLAGAVIQARTAGPLRAETAASGAAPWLAEALPQERAWRSRAAVPATENEAAVVTANASTPAYRQDDTLCLTQAVYYEARGESPTGQAAVAQVVLNRLRQPAFPKTVCGVVFQRSSEGCQFSFACDGALRRSRDDEAWRKAQAVARRALSGAAMADVRGATMFQTAVSAGRGAFAGGVLQVAQIGAHVFYRLTGRGAQGGASPASEERRPVGRDPVLQAPVHLVFASLAPTVAVAPPAPQPIIATPPDAARPVVPPSHVEATSASPAPTKTLDRDS